MSSKYSTRDLRLQVKRIPVEYCPKLTIAQLAKLGVFDLVNPRHFVFLQVEDRLDLGVHRDDMEGVLSLECFCRLTAHEEHKHQVIELVKLHSRNAKFPYRFVCPGKLEANEKYAGCGKQVDTLYIPDASGKGFLACTTCHGLSWLSRQTWRREPRRMKRGRPAVPAILPPGVVNGSAPQTI